MHRQEPAAERPRWDKERSSRWGVILAGGDGTRLLPLTRKISGDDRPKPFAAHMDHAFSQAEMDQERVILLGILPDAPEESYGWIEPENRSPEAPYPKCVVSGRSLPAE